MLLARLCGDMLHGCVFCRCPFCSVSLCVASLRARNKRNTHHVLVFVCVFSPSRLCAFAMDGTLHITTEEDDRTVRESVSSASCVSLVRSVVPLVAVASPAPFLLTMQKGCVCCFSRRPALCGSHGDSLTPKDSLSPPSHFARDLFDNFGLHVL